MKNLLIVLILFLFSFQITAQITGKVVNTETNQPISYTNIWIENQSFGTTSNEDGFFELEELSDTLSIVFSALGFETKRIKVSNLTPEIRLQPIAIELETVTVSSPNFRKENPTGKLKKKNVEFWYISSKQPWRIGKIFPYKSEYENSPFLKNIDLVVTTNETNRQLLIHVLEVGEGTPDNWEVLEQNILHTITKKDKNITTIDLEAYQIKMPKSGIMIITEALIIENNRYTFESVDMNTNQKVIRSWHDPKIGMLPAETTENTWIYSRGEWRKDTKRKNKHLKKYNDKYIQLAMELILSD